MSGVRGITPVEGDPKRDENVSPMAGRPASREMLVDVTRLEYEYFARSPNVEDPNQLVNFGTSGYRGSTLRASTSPAVTHSAVVDTEIEKKGSQLIAALGGP